MELYDDVAKQFLIILNSLSFNVKAMPVANLQANKIYISRIHKFLPLFSLLKFQCSCRFHTTTSNTVIVSQKITPLPKSFS